MKTVIDKVKASKMKCKRNRDAWKTKALEAVRELSFWKTQMAARDRQIEERWSGLRKQYQERIETLERANKRLREIILMAYRNTDLTTEVVRSILLLANEVA